MSEGRSNSSILKYDTNVLMRKKVIVAAIVTTIVLFIWAVESIGESSQQLDIASETQTTVVDAINSTPAKIAYIDRHTTSTARQNSRNTDNPDPVVVPPQATNPHVELEINGEQIDIPLSGRARNTVGDGRTTTDVDIDTRNDNVSIDTHSHNGQNVDISIEVHSQSTGESGDNEEEGGRRTIRRR